MNLNPLQAVRSLVGRSSRDEISGLGNPSVDLVAAIVASSDGSTASGVSVTPLKSFRLAAVYACVKAIACTVASLPIQVSRADADGGRDIVFDDPRRYVLNDFPNPEMTGMEVFETWIGHALLWGRGFLYIVWDGKGQPVELWPLRPDRTEPMRTKGTNQLYYYTELPDGTGKTLAAADVIAISSIFGMSPVTTARDTIAGAASAEQYSGRFWANNGRPGGVIELPEEMDEEQMDDFMRRWRAGHEGLKRAQLVGILTAGAKWQDVGIAPGLAQFIETREYQTREIARLFGVPPHRIGDLAGGTISRQSLEQQSIEFVTYTLREWLVRAEQALRLKLFAGKNDLSTDTKPRIDFTELMRGDIRSRYEAHALGIQWGFLNRKEVRQEEDKPSVGPEHQLDEFLVPMNMIPSSKLDQVEVSGKNGENNKDSGGTQPTSGSDGSTVQETKALNRARAIAFLAVLKRDHPELADQLAEYARDTDSMRQLERGDIDAADVLEDLEQ